MPNLTVGSFCHWVNNTPTKYNIGTWISQKISVETARKWMHELGFHATQKKKGTFVDGHERSDVVEYRHRFLRRMVGLGFLNSDNAATEDARKALPHGIPPICKERLDKTVIMFHDETTFQANDDQSTVWAEKGTSVMQPKSKGSGIMVSDFIEERNGYLCLNDEKYEKAHAAMADDSLDVHHMNVKPGGKQRVM